MFSIKPEIVKHEIREMLNQKPNMKEMKTMTGDWVNKKIYIFGAGKRGKFVLSKLRELGVVVEGFIDNDSTKQGIIDNVKCFSLDEIVVDSEDIIIIISPKERGEKVNQVKEKKMQWIYYEDVILPLFYLIPPKYMSDDFCNVRPFNWYESPYQDLKLIHQNEDEYFKKKEVLGIDFNFEKQLQLLRSFEKIELHKWNFDKEETGCNRYYYNNSMFGKGSADILYYMMRTIQPKKIIEVGSGFSTAAMLDTNEIYFDGEIEISCIEPNAQRLKSVIKPSDRLVINETELQNIPLSYFEKLEENDFLFIDSSHVSKIGSDVNYYLFEILPRLKKGVYVHIHDIAYPMEYPKNWIYEGRAYNEMYMLRAFLMYNNIFSVQFYGEMLSVDYPELLNDNFKEIGGSIWLRKDK